MKRSTQSIFSKVYAKKTSLQEPENIVCFFKFQTLQDSECAFEALQKDFVVILDLSSMIETEAIRLKDYMRGACAPLHSQPYEICDDYIAYFPKGYHLQIFEK